MDLIEKELSGEELFHAQTHIWNHLFSFINSMALRCAIQLGIPDIVRNHHQPITLLELVTKLAIPKIKTVYLFRLMRLLVHSGFFAIQENEGYVLTSSSKLLLKGSDKSVSPYLRAMLDPILVTPWNFLDTWFQGDDVLTPFQTTHGRGLWDYAGEDNELNIFLNEGMESDARLVSSLVVTRCKVVFEGLSSLIDVGGGTGTLAQTIGKTFPSLKCSVLDLPHVVAPMEGSENLKYIAGDMFEKVPQADAVLLKWILHDWNDEQCIKILKRCKDAISGEDREGTPGKVIIIDMVLEDKMVDNKSRETHLFYDLLMMTLLDGKERTEKEWGELFLEAGFTQYKIYPVLGLRSLIEVYP